MDVNCFSEKINRIYSIALKNNIKSGVLPDGKMYYNIAERTIRPANISCSEQSGTCKKAITSITTDDDVNKLFRVGDEKRKNINIVTIFYQILMMKDSRKCAKKLKIVLTD